LIVAAVIFLPGRRDLLQIVRLILGT